MSAGPETITPAEAAELRRRLDAISPPAPAFPDPIPPAEGSFSHTLMVQQEERRQAWARQLEAQAAARKEAEAAREAELAGLRARIEQLRARQVPIRARYESELAPLEADFERRAAPIETRYRDAMAPIEAELRQLGDEMRAVRDRPTNVPAPEGPTILDAQVAFNEQEEDAARRVGLFPKRRAKK